MIPRFKLWFTLKYCVFGVFNFYSGIGFDSCLFFSLPNFNWGKNAAIFGVENSLSVHID